MLPTILRYDFDRQFPKEAREKRDVARKQLSDNIDPGVYKAQQKIAATSAAENDFETIAMEWYNVQLSDKSESHKSRSLRMLRKELFPHIGRRPISDISPPELLMLLRRIENRGVVDTAHRAKQTAGQVFKYAIATGRTNRNPANDLTGALRPKNKTHYAAITTPKDVGKLMVAMDAFSGTYIVRSALKLSALFFLRPGELRHLEWDEVNWDEKRIEIKAEKMKTRQPHIVPVSSQAEKTLLQLHSLTGRGHYIFPSQRGNSRPLSENSVRVALRTMGYDNNTMTPHGFRAMARTLLDEELSYRIEWIEQQLAHEVKDVNGRAYNRTKHLKQRVEMMQKWADYLDMLKVKEQGCVLSSMD
ncbi:site-specific integrase [Endozoicomonas sp. 4G]|uniref:tyrosine-type recombinase/integrase n=1 Tax=Endozoicomonas sp. 4G TaxID=2872754 RepID=UPI002078F1A3|nr:site-specific integrase [Endozoicomonas sp. 4G]